MAVKFNRYNVSSNGIKASVFYSVDNRTDGRKCVTIYARDYSGNLGKVLADAYQNNTEIMVDYFEKGKAVLFEEHPLYREARVRAEMKYPPRANARF